MNIVKPVIYTEHMTALDSGLNKLQWSMRNRAPNAEVVEIARDVQSAMIRLQEYIVRHYEGRAVSKPHGCYNESFDGPRCEKWCGDGDCR